MNLLRHDLDATRNEDLGLVVSAYIRCISFEHLNRISSILINSINLALPRADSTGSSLSAYLGKEIDIEVNDQTDNIFESKSYFDEFVESVKDGKVDTEALKASTTKRPLLMTGADLLKQIPEAAELPQGFSVVRSCGNAL